MKKLMFAASAALIATVGLGVESANIVGYQAVSKGAVKQPMFGFTFTPVSGAVTNSTIKLGSVTASGMESTDRIQVINPTTLASSAVYTYYSDALARAEAADEAEGETGATEGEEYEEVYAEVYAELKENVGWWVAGKFGTESADDVVVNPGDAFLGLSPTANPLTFNFKSVLDLTPVSE